MNITYIGSDGTFLQHEQVKLAAPVNATLNINSTDVGYDPRDFFAAFRAVAKETVGTSTTGSQGIEGMMQADDGVWEDDEEL